MKPNILHKTIATLLLALPIAHADDKKEEKKEERKAEEKKDGAKSGKTISSGSITASADGTATVIIDINGKKETRTFKLGDGNNSFTFGEDGNGGVVSRIGELHASAELDGKNLAMPGQVKREKGPWVGIAMEPVQDVVRAQLSLAPGEGVVVNHVAPESPAAKAGLQPNDILLRFEDQILVEPSQLRKLIAMKKAGDSVKLGYLRKGERKDANVTLVEHELEASEHGPMQWLQMAPGMGGFKAGGAQTPGAVFKGGDGIILGERMQDQLKQLKEKHPGVIVNKQTWLSGAQGDLLKGQIEKLLRGLEESKLPKEQIEHLRKEFQRAQHEAEEAMENAKRNPENNGFKPRQKEKGENPKGENPKKPGEPL